MPEYLAPGVYVEEIPTRLHPIEGVSTSTAGLIGVSETAAAPVTIASFADFERAIGGRSTERLALAVRGFFENGGTLCSVALIAATDPLESGLDALANEKLSILCCPDDDCFPNAAAAMAAHCEQRKDRVCILQSPQPVVPDASHEAPVHSSYAAYYYPWLTVTGIDGTSSVAIPPGGHIAGVYARTGVAQANAAPAGVPLAGVQALSQEINAAESDLLVSRGINPLRSFPGKGILIWGARTTSEDAEWRYVNVRRLLVFVEQSIDQGLQWAVFEPNGPALWANVRAAVDDFLFSIWSTGALAGQKPEDAFFVRCDRTTMTQSDVDAGRFVMIVGVAPLKPAEFVIIRITGQTHCAAAAAAP